MIKVIPYKLGSKSGKALAKGLNALRIKSPNYRQKRRDVLVNWGASSYSPRIYTVLNDRCAVMTASNKLASLERFKLSLVPHPEFTTDPEVAKAWLAEKESRKVVCRHILNGHSGRGIQVIKHGEELPHAPLYTRYFKKDQEYRVHVAGGVAFDTAQKKLRNGLAEAPGRSPYVRNHANGWIFARCDVAPPAMVIDAAIRAVAALGLDFGAVDVAVRGDKVVVFEVNTAPGLEGTTLTNYIAKIRELCYPIGRR